MKVKSRGEVMQKDQTLHSILSAIAEEAAPTRDMDLWPTVRAHLLQGKNLEGQMEIPMKSNLARKSPLRLVTTSVLLLLLALGLLFSLSQGQAWAQNILRFFTRASDRIDLPTSQPVNLVGVTPGAAQATLTRPAAWHSPFFATCGDLPDPHCSVEQLRELVDFPVMEIGNLPEGMQFSGGSGGPDGVMLLYRRQDPDSSLLLYQIRGEAVARPAVPIGDSADVKQVKVGEAYAEYVKGSYFYYGGEKSAVWDENAQVESLYWEEGDMQYSLTLMGADDFPQGQMDENGLVGLALSLTRRSLPQDNQTSQESTKSAAEAGKEAGFQVIQPAWLPQGYHFERADYQPQRGIVCLVYFHSDDQRLSSLSIAESVRQPLPEPQELIMEGLRPEQVILEQTQLPLGGALDEKGLYVYGSVDAEKLCGGNSQQVLFFDVPGLHIAIAARTAASWSSGHNWLTRQEMLKVAESISGVHIIADDQPDREFLTSIEDARRLAGFALKVPSILPQGMNFNYARLSVDGAEHSAEIYYSDGTQTIGVRQTLGSPETLQDILAKGAQMYRHASVHNQDALISQGYWKDDGWKDIPDGGDGGASVTWFEDGIEYSLSGFNAYPSAIWLEIAESLK